MGRPEADSSSYDESFQPQEDQYEQTQADFSAHAYETSYDDPSQSQYGGTTVNNPQDQQPRQANQGYGGQPAQPSQFPPQGPQTSPMYTNGPRRPAHTHHKDHKQTQLSPRHTHHRAPLNFHPRAQ
ncbi:hypothetical protein OIU85_013852 [Salix viminalis]|uniref:Uncharacterized protein n=1 Tax=Salix viminalis TaxID=40686 RepID=A0A9Q0SD03_SALVM|nr:hypothetical protein OIU85_013852 [Salix viminalis]